MQGMFDNLWMLGNEGEDKEEEEEESEDEEGPVQPAAAAVRPQENGAVSSVLAGVSLPPQAAAQTGGLMCAVLQTLSGSPHVVI
jgi:hypothetical protein